MSFNSRIYDSGHKEMSERWKNNDSDELKLPDLKPWFDNESDLYEELPFNDEFPYD